MNYVEYGKENSDIIILLHGGGLSWWNYKETAKILQTDYHVILPILDGHAGSDKQFTTIENNALEIIEFVNSKLGGSVLMSDTKEEKKSTVINLGIPLLTTLASAIYGTAKCMSGGKALLFGFATGQIASIAAGTIDKFVTNHSRKKNLIAQNQTLNKQA